MLMLLGPRPGLVQSPRKGSTALSRYQCPNQRVRSTPPISWVCGSTSNSIKEALRKRFATQANDFDRRLHQISAELSSLSGPLEDQKVQISSLQSKLSPLGEALAEVKKAEDDCVAANVEDENDYTIFTHRDLVFELELVVAALAKKIAFIENQVRL